MASRTNPLLVKLGSLAFLRAQRFFEKKDAVAAERVGERLGRIGYRLDKKHRERAILNLGLAYPDLTLEERQRLALRTFEHFGRVAADFLRATVRSDAEVLESLEEFDSSVFERAKECERGTLLITAHLGNWERFAHWLQASGRPLAVVARDADDSGIQSAVQRIRESSGVEVLSRGNSARAILTKLREHRMVGILPDQNSEESFVPFFGKPCGTVLGPAVIHLRTGAPLVVGFCVRVGPGKYRAEVSEPLIYKRGETSPEQIMADLNLRIEDAVRKVPDQYLWLHDRWKSARRRGKL